MKKKPRILARGLSQEEATELMTLLRNLIHEHRARGKVQKGSHRSIFGTDRKEETAGVRVVAYRMKQSELDMAKAFVTGYFSMVQKVKIEMSHKGEGYFAKSNRVQNLMDGFGITTIRPKLKSKVTKAMRLKELQRKKIEFEKTKRRKAKEKAKEKAKVKRRKAMLETRRAKREVLREKPRKLLTNSLLKKLGELGFVEISFKWGTKTKTLSLDLWLEKFGPKAKFEVRIKNNVAAIKPEGSATTYYSIK